MKQNQHHPRFVPNDKPELTPHHFLNIKAHCTCTQCKRISDPINPEITLDQELIILRASTTKNQHQCDFLFFLRHLKDSQKKLPKFQFLDTVVMKDGEPSYAVYFQRSKLMISEHINLKTWIIERKESSDLHYQIKKHQRENNFSFTAFEHKCQKKIKEFQNHIKYKIPSVLNKTAMIKMRGHDQQLVLSRNEFLNMFDLNKKKTYQMKNIQYIQVFPIMTGEEEHSHLKTVKYFRDKECNKKSFKLAEAYVSTWKEKNDSIEKLQQDVYEEIKQLDHLDKITEEHQLLYQSYKLLIYFQVVSNIRVQQAVLYYITNDNGKSFFFKSIECLRTEKRVSVDDIGVELPTKRQTAPEDYIHLPTEMRGLFDGFQSHFQRLDREREEMESRVKKDKEFSNFVFKQLSSKKTDNFHEVLLSRNVKYKKDQLNL